MIEMVQRLFAEYPLPSLLIPAALIALDVARTFRRQGPGRASVAAAAAAVVALVAACATLGAEPLPKPLVIIGAGAGACYLVNSLVPGRRLFGVDL